MSGEDSGVDAGSDSNESVTMSVVSSNGSRDSDAENFSNAEAVDFENVISDFIHGR